MRTIFLRRRRRFARREAVGLGGKGCSRVDSEGHQDIDISALCPWAAGVGESKARPTRDLNHHTRIALPTVTRWAELAETVEKLG